MNPFSQELKNAREARQLTLADISQQTRIHIKYLQAIEQGTFDVLPQTYVRAFIKAYAETVGMSAVEALRQYDIHSTPEHRSETAAVKDEAHISARPEQTDRELQQEKRVRVATISAVIVIGVIVLAFFLMNYFDTVVPSQTVKETSFQDIVKEQEQVLPAAAVADTADTTAALPVKSPEPPKPDSLVLRIISSDSVWITINRDNQPQRSGYMLDGRYRTYTAKKSFMLSISNGGVVRMLLNGKELPPAGKRGERVRNLKITADDLPKK